MTPTREQLIEDIAGKLWRDLCEGEGQHSEALDKSLIRKHMDRLAACLAAPPPGACLCCRDGCQDGCGCKDTSRHEDLPPMGRLAAPSQEAAPMPPIEVGDVVALVNGNAEAVLTQSHADYWNDRRPELLRAERITAIYRTPLWTREPRR